MFSNFSNKQKLIGLFTMFIVFLFACYQIAFKKTINECNNYFRIKTLNENAVEDSIETKLFYKKEERLNNLFKHFQVDTVNESNKILGIVSESCTKYSNRLKEYRPFTTINKDSLSVFTVMIVMEGTFSSLVSEVFELETKNIAGKISSANFKKYNDPTNKIQKLACTFYIQNVLITNDSYAY